MGLDVAIATALKDSKDLGPMEKATMAASAVVTALEDTALRREVFDVVTEQNDDLSMMEVHQILDALVRVCSYK